MRCLASATRSVAVFAIAASCATGDRLSDQSRPAVLYGANSASMIFPAAAIIAAMPGVTASQTPIRSLLVANRGEIAVRVIRAAHDLSIRAVAVYGKGEHEAMHVRLADDAWCIPSAAPIPYLDIPAIIEVAHRGNADAIHPGYGFLA